MLTAAAKNICAKESLSHIMAVPRGLPACPGQGGPAKRTTSSFLFISLLGLAILKQVNEW